MKNAYRLIFTIIPLITMAACSTFGFSMATAAPMLVAETTTAVSLENSIGPTMIAADIDSIENLGDYTWDSTTEINIAFADTEVSTDGQGISVDGSHAEINAAGIYHLTGNLTNGQITVNTGDEETVHLILDNVSITNQTGAAINIESAEKVVIVLADSTHNTLSDSTNYSFPSTDVEEPNSALFSKANLIITGAGTLTVNGNYMDSIASKDGLIIESGTLIINAVDDGIRGKDYLVIKAGTLVVNSGGDGFKSDNKEESGKGFIQVQSGTITINSGGDAITAGSDVIIAGGEFNLNSGGGSNHVLDETTSSKAIKADGSILLENGTFTIDAADDALHSAEELIINSGSYNLATADDGIHSDTSIVINNGTVNILNSYEGIEAAMITVNGGEINLKASDDGLNVSTGSSEGEMVGPGQGMGEGQSAFTYTGSNYLLLHGGTIRVDAGGDGLDSNGAIEMTDGLVIVNGPTNNGNAALDYNGGFRMTGGTLIAVGSAGMAQAPGSYSTQNSLLVNFETNQAAGTVVHLQNISGEEVITFAPLKVFQSVVISSPKLVTGQSYRLLLGGNSNGTNSEGIYEGGSYTGGKVYQEVTLSDVVTTIGTTAGFMDGRGGMGNRGAGQPYPKR